MIDFEFDGRTGCFYEMSDRLEIIDKILELHVQMEWKPDRGGAYEDVAYMNIPTSFDIETTTINIGSAVEPKYIGFMYIWQFAIGDIAICGRTWAEFQDLLGVLKRTLKLKPHKRLPIYAHNASYEFQFMRNFIEVEKVFARKKRVIVTADFDSAFQLRCSWALSNMSLEKAINTVPNAKHGKLAGKFDYKKIRTPETELSDMEYMYCYNDVMGLNEYLSHLLQTNDDNFTTVPITSTGFIRREVRKAVLENPKNKKEVEALALSPRLYVYAKTGSRGGNCHASAFFTNVLLEYVKSKDRKSSYPAEMMVADNFPVSGFREVRPSNDNFIESIATSACLFDITFYDLRLKAPTAIPYIAIAKCTRVKFSKDHLRDNGRVVACECANMIITEVDFNIIEMQYEYSGYVINSLYSAKRGHLNDEFRKTLYEAFVTKCSLESGDPYLYAKFKNKINAYFGMMLTDICNPTVIYDQSKDEVWSQEVIDIESLLNKYYHSKRSFLSYQHGLWVTANARYELQMGINAVGLDCVYVDTDSVKYIDDHESDFQKVNERWLALCDNNDISPIVEMNGKKFILGLWETEKTADKFKTLGAKKYCCMYGDELKPTVAGLSKKLGGEYLKKHGGIDAFDIDTEVPAGDSGRTTSYYNDVKEPFHIEVEGCDIVVGSNIAIVEASYTFGVSEDYLRYYTSVQ